MASRGSGSSRSGGGGGGSSGGGGGSAGQSTSRVLAEAADAAAAGGHRGVAIAVVTPKGGVGKTTIAVNVGSALAAGNGDLNMPKQLVCIIDADTQGNLTTYFEESHGFGQGVTIKYSQDAISLAGGEPRVEMSVVGRESVDNAWSHEAFEAKSMREKQHPRNINTFCRHVFRGSKLLEKPYARNGPPLVNMDKGCSVDVDVAAGSGAAAGSAAGSAASTISKDLAPLLVRVNPDDDGLDHLFIIKGSKNFFDWESMMTEALHHGQDINANVADDMLLKREILRRGVFRRLVRGLIDDYGFDFVIFDCPPANSSLNEAICLSCDYILPPLNTDSFSVSGATDFVGSLLPKWYEEHDKIMKKQTRLYEREETRAYMTAEEPGLEKYFYGTPPRILPLLVNKFGIAVRNPNEIICVDGGYVVTVQDMLIQKRKRQAAGELTEWQAKVMDALVPCNGRVVVPLLPDFASEVRIAEGLGKPLVRLDDDGQDHMSSSSYCVYGYAKKSKKDHEIYGMEGQLRKHFDGENTSGFDAIDDAEKTSLLDNPKSGNARNREIVMFTYLKDINMMKGLTIKQRKNVVDFASSMKVLTTMTPTMHNRHKQNVKFMKHRLGTFAHWLVFVKSNPHWIGSWAASGGGGGGGGGGGAAAAPPAPSPSGGAGQRRRRSSGGARKPSASGGGKRAKRTRVESSPTFVLKVTNLDASSVSEDLLRVFFPHSALVQYDVNGSARVEYDTLHAATAARDKWHGKMCCEQHMNVVFESDLLGASQEMQEM